MAKKAKKKKFTLSSFTIIMLIIVAIAIISYLLPLATFDGENIVNGSGVVRAKFSDFLMAPIKGFENAADVGVFILILGGFLNVVTKTGALETGIKVLVNKLKGKELVLIPILMFIFSVGGTTYGMLEETVAFYGLLSFTMVAAGMDTIVASATVLLGAGVGVLGSTINPFAVGAAVSALPDGIKVLVNKLKGKELVLIPILMFIFSVGGTTYGMLEETVAFYGLLSFTMVAAGMDTIVASATVLLGAGVGVLGSTINPFAVGAAVSALPDGIKVNQGTIILLGCILWLVSYIIAVAFVLNYAAKVKAEKGSTFLSLQEQKQMEKHYAKDDFINPDVKLTTRQKLILIIFGLTFVIMIAGFIPWVDFGIIPADIADAGTHFTAFLTGNCFGYWYFEDAAVLFFVMAIVIGIIGKLSEKEFVDTFVDGASDILSVILIIAVARGASVLMQVTYLDNYIIYNAANALKNMPAVIYAPMNFILHIFLSILVPSSSGIATLSTPIMGGLTHQLGFSVETNVMILVASNGLVNLISPTCGAIMGGLALARVEYSTWFKWAFKIVACIGLAAMVILTIAMCVL